MSAWHRAHVVDRRPAGRGLFVLRLAVPPAVEKSFHSAGQYHRLSVGGVGQSYFAVASAPGVAPFEYLVREGTEVTEALRRVTQVEVSMLEGLGFPLQRAVGRPVALVGAGTGISALRSALEAIRQRRADFGAVRLLHGVRTQAEVPFSDEHQAWRDEGIEVRVSASQPGPGWKGAVGRVQNHLSWLSPSGAVALVCGHREMEHETAAALRAAGAHDVFVNHDG